MIRMPINLFLLVWFFGLLILFLWVIFFVNGSLLPGTRGPNRGGPDPLAPKGADKDTALETFREAVIRTDVAQMTSHQPDQKNRVEI